MIEYISPLFVPSEIFTTLYRYLLEETIKWTNICIQVSWRK